jgi:nicotinate-nucleotide adenylyltransferase
VTGTSALEQPASVADRSEIREHSLGILGGTFNPPHRGHLALARHARRELGLEHVLLVPAHTAPYKAAGEAGSGRPSALDPGPAHRLRMCQLALAGEPGLSVCAVEIERGGLSYTVDTLRSIHASHSDAELTFIVGADTASTLGSWREPAQLLELARLAVATRAGATHERVLDALAGIPRIPRAGAESDGERPSAATRVSFLEMPAIEVSSSMTRERLARGEAVDALVGPAVAGYIAEHHLYASAVASR